MSMPWLQEVWAKAYLSYVYYLKNNIQSNFYQLIILLELNFKLIEDTRHKESPGAKTISGLLLEIFFIKRNRDVDD